MTGPALYQHRPTIVRAIQWTPASRQDVADWLALGWPGEYQFSGDGDTHLLILTPEGDRDCNAEDGYWLVEGVAHELYCVRPDVFARVYEPAGPEPEIELRLGGRAPGLYIDGQLSEPAGGE